MAEHHNYDLPNDASKNFSFFLESQKVMTIFRNAAKR